MLWAEGPFASLQQTPPPPVACCLMPILSRTVRALGLRNVDRHANW
jgi:hypothetical protein